MKQIIIVSMLLQTVFVHAQKITILPLEDFINQVKKNHPIAKQARIITEYADANTMMANGAFDPTIGYEANQKKLEGIEYFTYNHAEVKYNTPIGVTIKTGVESANGSFANSELTQGTASYIGAEVQLLKGLLIDKNRATLRKAKVMQQQSIQEQNIVLNDLLFDAYQAYMQWAAQYQLYKIVDGYLQNAKQRFDLVKISYVNGDRAQADTVEAKTQLQNFELLQTENTMQLQNASIELAQHIWNENGEPSQLLQNIIPDTNAFLQPRVLQNADNLIAQLETTNPQLKAYQFKLKQLEIDKQLKKQNQLPTLNLQANALSKSYYNPTNLFGLQNNHKLGVQFKLPILLRESRGDLQIAKLKIQETQWQLQNKNWMLQTKIRQYINTSDALRVQLSQTSAMINNFQFLVNNENLKFAQGETTIFLMNTREMKLLEMQQKQVELQIKFVKSYYAALWSFGGLQ
jgi:outer membrane protein TolC